MVLMEHLTKGVNTRCKTAMRLAGYTTPRAVSANKKDPMRPSFETLITSRTTAETGMEFKRVFDCTLIFFPENIDRPHLELKRMDDAVTQAFCLPIEADGQELSMDEVGIETGIQAGCLVTTIRYDSYFDVEDEDDFPTMNVLELTEQTEESED